MDTPTELDGSSSGVPMASVPPLSLEELNQADDQKLSVYLGRKLRLRLLEYREKNGPFRHVSEIRKVRGIGSKVFEFMTGIKADDPELLREKRIAKLLKLEYPRPVTIREILQIISQFKGVKGVVLSTLDGLPMESILPPEYDVDAVCALGPACFNKTSKYTRALAKSDSHIITTYLDNGPITIILSGDFFFIVVHTLEAFPQSLIRRAYGIAMELGDVMAKRA